MDVICFLNLDPFIYLFLFKLIVEERDLNYRCFHLKHQNISIEVKKTIKCQLLFKVILFLTLLMDIIYYFNSDYDKCRMIR